MNLKNYTSSVSVSKTVSRIEEILMDIGAKTIGKNIADGKLQSITFQMTMDGRDHLVRLPANPEAVFKALSENISRPHARTFERIREQSERTAWKLRQDWLEVELSLIQLQQKKPMEAFLSYIWDGQQTYFAHLEAGKFKQLPEKT